MKKKVFGTVFQSENDVLGCATTAYVEVLNRLGFDAALINLGQAQDVDRLLSCLKSGAVAFVFGYQGVGSRLDVAKDESLWSFVRTPFVAIHFDHPCYNPYNHFGATPYVGHLYHFDFQLQAKQKYLPSPQVTGRTQFRLHVRHSPDQPPFSRRDISYLYVKTGETHEETETYFATLPAPLRDGVRDAIALAMKSENLDLCALAEDLFRTFGATWDQFQVQFWDIVRSIDKHVRAARAIQLVEWLKGQEGAVIVGNGWDFIDKDHARATFKPSVPAKDCFPLYTRAKFLLNTNPYGKDFLHERIMLGLAAGCCVVSDRNAWLDAYRDKLPPLGLYGFDAPLEDQIRPLFDAPDAAARAETANDLAHKFFGPTDIPPMVPFAEQVRAFAEKVHARNAAGLPNANAPGGTSL